MKLSLPDAASHKLGHENIYSRTLWTQLDSLDFAECFALLYHTQPPMKGFRSGGKLRLPARGPLIGHTCAVRWLVPCLPFWMFHSQI